MQRNSIISFLVIIILEIISFTVLCVITPLHSVKTIENELFYCLYIFACIVGGFIFKYICGDVGNIFEQIVEIFFYVVSAVLIALTAVAFLMNVFSTKDETHHIVQVPITVSVRLHEDRLYMNLNKDNANQVDILISSNSNAFIRDFSASNKTLDGYFYTTVPRDSISLTADSEIDSSDTNLGTTASASVVYQKEWYTGVTKTSSPKILCMVDPLISQMLKTRTYYSSVKIKSLQLAIQKT